MGLHPDLLRQQVLGRRYRPISSFSDRDAALSKCRAMDASFRAYFLTQKGLVSGSLVRIGFRATAGAGAEGSVIGATLR